MQVTHVINVDSTRSITEKTRTRSLEARKGATSTPGRNAGARALQIRTSGELAVVSLKRPVDQDVDKHRNTQG